LRANDLLGHPPHLEPKGKGESSMVEKRLNAKIWSVTCRKSCVHG